MQSPQHRKRFCSEEKTLMKGFIGEFLTPVWPFSLVGYGSLTFPTFISTHTNCMSNIIAIPEEL